MTSTHIAFIIAAYGLTVGTLATQALLCWRRLRCVQSRLRMRKPHQPHQL
ncbi:MAG: hypothetical protein AAYR33_06185 [Acetobacteraceae bacterium]